MSSVDFDVRHDVDYVVALLAARVPELAPAEIVSALTDDLAGKFLAALEEIEDRLDAIEDALRAVSLGWN